MWQFRVHVHWKIIFYLVFFMFEMNVLKVYNKKLSALDSNFKRYVSEILNKNNCHLWISFPQPSHIRFQSFPRNRHVTQNVTNWNVTFISLKMLRTIIVSRNFHLVVGDNNENCDLEIQNDRYINGTNNIHNNAHWGKFEEPLLAECRRTGYQ